MADREDHLRDALSPSPLPWEQCVDTGRSSLKVLQVVFHVHPLRTKAGFMPGWLPSEPAWGGVGVPGPVPLGSAREGSMLNGIGHHSLGSSTGARQSQGLGKSGEQKTY